LQDPILKKEKNNQKKRAARVAQGGSHEFKSQYCKNEKKIE
jgi:hypothetical protein